MGDGDKMMIRVAWGQFLLSIVAGIWCLFATVGSIQEVAKDPASAKTVYSGNTAIPMGVQQISFVLAVVCTLVVGVKTI